MSVERGFLVPVAEPDYAGGTATKYLNGENWQLRQEADVEYLLDEISSKGLSVDKALPVGELLDKLDRTYFDEEVARRVVPGSTAETRITARKFAEAFLARRREAREAFDKAVQELDTIERLLHSADKGLAYAQSAPATLDREESKLTVQTVQVRNFHTATEEGTAFKLHLECQGQAIETKTQIYRDARVFWNEMFSFQIESPDGDLHVTLSKVDFHESPAGEASIILEDLSDQRKHELTRDLLGGANCELQISCQWVYSKKVLYSNHVRELTAERENKTRELVQLQIETERYERVLRRGGTRDGGAAFGGMPSVGGLLEGPEMLSDAIGRAMDHMSLSNYQVATQYVVGICLVLCCIASYMRPLFLDLQVMAFAFWCNLDARRWTSRRYLVVLGGIVLSEIFDIAWIVTYFPAWSNSTAEASMQNVTKVFSFFNMLWKLMAGLFFWKCYHDQSQKMASRSGGRAATANRNAASSGNMAGNPGGTMFVR